MRVLCTDCIAASLRGVRSLPMSSRHPSCSEVGTTLLTSDCRGLAWNHRLWSSMPLIWDCEEGTIAQCLAFQLPVTGFFFWPLGLSRVCLDSAKCSIYFSCWAASIFCNMHTHILLHMPPYNTRMHILRSRLWVFLLCLYWVINNSALLIKLCTKSFLL